MLNAGTSVDAVSRLFGCTRKTIERLQRRFRATGNVRDRFRSGRPRVTTAADDRYIIMQHLRNRRLPAAATGRQQNIHPQTVGNRLRQNVQPISAYQPYFGQMSQTTPYCMGTFFFGSVYDYVGMLLTECL